VLASIPHDLDGDPEAEGQGGVEGLGEEVEVRRGGRGGGRARPSTVEERRVEEVEGRRGGARRRTPRAAGRGGGGQEGRGAVADARRWRARGR
jgi:hypothetical protein